MSVHGCGLLDDVIAELALGVLDGAERAAALAHIEQCPDCQAEVAALTTAGEQLLLLASEIPPPAGFESRVLDQIAGATEAPGPDGPGAPGRSSWPSPRHMMGGGRQHRPTRRVLLVAAAVLVVVGGLAALLGAWAGSDSGGTGDVDVVAAPMVTERGAVVGTATLRRSSPPVMELDLGGWLDSIVEQGGRLDARWWLSVENADGASEMYAVALSKSSSSLVTLDHEPGDIAAVSLLDEEGRTWCSGRFPT